MLFWTITALIPQKKLKMFKYQISLAYPYIVILYKNTIWIANVKLNKYFYGINNFILENTDII